VDLISLLLKSEQGKQILNSIGLLFEGRNAGYSFCPKCKAEGKGKKSKIPNILIKFKNQDYFAGNCPIHGLQTNLF
jgi:hypothetical protein